MSRDLFGKKYAGHNTRKDESVKKFAEDPQLQRSNSSQAMPFDRKGENDKEPNLPDKPMKVRKM